MNFRVEKITHDTVVVTKDDGSVFMYTCKDYFETDRLIRLFSWLGVPADDTYSEKCERESKLEMDRLRRLRK